MGLREETWENFKWGGQWVLNQIIALNPWLLRSSLPSNELWRQRSIWSSVISASSGYDRFCISRDFHTLHLSKHYILQLTPPKYLGKKKTQKCPTELNASYCIQKNQLFKRQISFHCMVLRWAKDNIILMTQKTKTNQNPNKPTWKAFRAAHTTS